MSELKEARRHHRRTIDCEVSLTWEDGRGELKFLRARGLDLSQSGLRVESAESIQASSVVYFSMDEYGLVGTACVRHVTRRGLKYSIGLEFLDQTSKSDVANEEGEFFDYYELLQISPKAEVETIYRVYRLLAQRYHPDNAETGDVEKFLQLRRAYMVLADPTTRIAYDSHYEAQKAKPMPIFGLKEFVDVREGEANRRLGVLCLLYNRRRVNPDNPGLSLLDFERLMGFPREHLLFTVWFLKEMGYVRTENNGDYAVTAEGAVVTESQVPSHSSLNQFIYTPRIPAPESTRGKVNISEVRVATETVPMTN